MTCMMYDTEPFTGDLWTHTKYVFINHQYVLISMCYKYDTYSTYLLAHT